MAFQYDCGTPFAECTGTVAPMVESGNRRAGPPQGQFKLHSDAESARKCHKAYCKRRSAEGNGIYIPSKPQRVRRGKTPHGTGANRWQIPAFRG